MSITFSSCFYILHSKFNPVIYVQWMDNFISIVNNFNLVIYADENSVKYINTKSNPKIKIIIKPLEQFYNYKYKEHWIENHKKNISLNHMTCWELNMLWSEKIQFVKETIERKYFDTDFYGWCDIGYFRNRNTDMHTLALMKWPDPQKIRELDPHKIVYGCINNDDNYIQYLRNVISNKTGAGVPVQPIAPNQQSIAGGFFIGHKDKIAWWAQTYDTKLQAYFNAKYLVKDDQIILADCIFSELSHFVLYRENTTTNTFDNWFMFQRILH